MNPCYLFLILFLPLPLMAAVTAELDKTELFQGQKLTLTLETDQQNASRPDLQQLQRDHLILSTRQVTVSSHSTGAVTTTTRWVVQLRPKREGEIRIPALEVAGELSPALNFTVLPATQNPGLGETDRAIFLEVETDRDELYLNSQLILKAKLYHLSTLPTDASLSAPQSQDALVKPLDEQRQYTQEVRGQSYTVTESSYAIFPREPGEVEISPLFFSATLPGGNLLELQSEPRLLSVLPAAYTSSQGNWLPANSLYIEDNLQQRSQLNQGQSLRRIISMEAEGLPAADLPSMSGLLHDSAQIQLINVVLEERVSETGLVSQRVEELLITPHAAGEINLPAIDIPWWDIEKEQGQHAQIPQRSLNVLNAAAASRPSMAEASSDSDSSSLLIWLLTAITMLTTLGFIYSWHKLKQLRKGSPATHPPNREIDPPLLQPGLNQVYDRTEERYFSALAEACNQNNPAETRINLIAWAQRFWQDESLNSVEQFCQLANNKTINVLILDLEQHLYSATPELWQGDLLFEALSRIRQRQQHRT
ncbi:BatD family protein [Neptuniibacter halophilus]|uniref:BatD family protein n=1 Tax=Neptuniibacter halophilus TaxID=651666 RepID=UPI00257229FA|nr:BatD family protein [Neptuniibacter halophilus]